MDSSLIIWVLAAVALISLGISAVALVIQVRRSNSRNQTPADKAKANQQSAPYIPPSPPPAAQGQWRPPVVGDTDEYGERTEALFPSERMQGYPVGVPQGYPQSAGWQVCIRETSPTGERTFYVTVSREFPIGRTVTNGLQIDNTTVSGLQCILIEGQDCVFVSNRSNSNVTRLNGVLLEETRPVKAGDALGFGHIQLLLVEIKKHAAY